MTAVSQAGFCGLFSGAALMAQFDLGWAWRASWLAGVTLSTAWVYERAALRPRSLVILRKSALT